jgi:peptide/nickel transport system permease protein
MSRLLPWLLVAALSLLGVAGLVSGHDVVGAVDADALGLAPSATHPLGTDGLGRDVLARLAVAVAAIGRPAALAWTVALALGIPAGCLQALGPRPLRAPARAPMELLGTVPGLVLVLLLCVVGDGGPSTIGLGVGLAVAPAVAGDVSTVLRDLQARGVFEAGRVHGVGWPALLGRHALWGGCRHRLLAHALDVVVWVAALEATLSYLGGFGTQEPAPSLGNMLAHGLGSPVAATGTWLAPGLALAGLAWSLDQLAGRARGGAGAG